MHYVCYYIHNNKRHKEKERRIFQPSHKLLLSMELFSPIDKILTCPTFILKEYNWYFIMFRILKVDKDRQQDFLMNPVKFYGTFICEFHLCCTLYLNLNEKQVILSDVLNFLAAKKQLKKDQIVVYSYKMKLKQF